MNWHKQIVLNLFKPIYAFGIETIYCAQITLQLVFCGVKIIKIMICVYGSFAFTFKLPLKKVHNLISFYSAYIHLKFNLFMFSTNR